mmetsp:Transcript_12353/g.10653  ORF Transcript_12353/g.10653 Transcript_12353/m.10653 type:complete len:89 (-) Transcript_12353:777-1043(-)
MFTIDGTQVSGPKSKSIKKGSHIFIPRQEVRQILYDHLPKEVDMKWSTTLESYEKLEDGSFNAVLSDKQTAHFDVIVNCEGVYSNLRS